MKVRKIRLDIENTGEDWIFFSFPDPCKMKSDNKKINGLPGMSWRHKIIENYELDQMFSKENIEIYVIWKHKFHKYFHVLLL